MRKCTVVTLAFHSLGDFWVIRHNMGWDISNADRLGKSETQLVNIFIEGVSQIIRWEQALEAGQDIEAEVAKASLPAKY